jgi:hypothetical protein
MKKKELLEIMEKIKNNEKDNLEKLPYPLNIQYQTAWLLGYADCWCKLYREIENR